ncbi:SET domain-containing protein 5 [Termitomyces sp. T112]|nr:SET domain-containing protein 5 [Termitomyces sp. T112]
MKRGFLKSDNKAAASAQADSQPLKSDSTLTMKRGFLKTSNKVASSPQADTKAFKPILIPAAPEVPPDIPLSAKIDTHKPHFRVVSSLPTLKIPTCFLLYPGTKEAMLEQCEPVKGSFPFTSIPFDIKEVPGQGRGTFAMHAFNIGDIIWDEYPMFVAPVGLYAQSVLSPEYYFKIAIDNLPPHYNSLFYELHNCRSNDPQDVRGIIDTNAIDIGRLPGPYEGKHMGIFPTISRVNHSCSPNADYIWNLRTFTCHLVALRHIAAGEQIFIAYTPISDPRTSRQEYLRSKYAFTCTCASCTLPKDLSVRSDIKRKILSSALDAVPKQQKEHEGALRQWVADLSLPDDHLLKPARFLMQIMEEEQAFDAFIWLTQAEIVCKALCALGDRAGAVELAQKASAYAKTRFFGDDAGWSKVAAAPEKTEWWGLRKKTIIT